MNKSIEQMIETLLVNDEAKNKLRVIDKLLNSKLDKVRQSTPALLVTAREGCGFSSYGRAYAEIVDSSIALKVKGSSSFLELVFPKDNEKEERLFFASPRRIASIRNRYYGTMLISLKEYSGLDLIKSESFHRLLEFLSLNKNNVHFMFHILPGFAAKNQLLLKLQDVINVAEVALDTPNIDNGFTYVVTELRENGYVMDDKALAYLREVILPKIIWGKTYTGYKSLNVLLDRVHLEVAMAYEGAEMILKYEMLQTLMIKYEKEEELSQVEAFKIGFSM